MCECVGHGLTVGSPAPRRGSPSFLRQSLVSALQWPPRHERRERVVKGKDCATTSPPIERWFCFSPGEVEVLLILILLLF